MQNAMRERQMSMQLAGAREMFNWLATFYGIATIGMFAGWVLHNAQLFTQSFPTRKTAEQEKNLNLDQEDVKKEKSVIVVCLLWCHFHMITFVLFYFFCIGLWNPKSQLF